MQFHKNFNLKNYNTFGIEAHCSTFVEVQSIEDVCQVLSQNTLPLFLLGGGSNVLFLNEFYDMLFLKNGIKGIEIIQDTEGGTIVEIGGGVVWHEFVLWAIENNLGGVENMSLIPGTVGAAPIQNIGAYGVELKDVFEKLDAINLQTLDIQTFTKEDCQFGYRDSVFKNELKGQFLITKVYLRLRKNSSKLNTSYGDILKVFIEKKIEQPTIRDVSNAVIAIRQSKLPDPLVIGNAGSFFKNPTIPKAQFEVLKEKHPNIIGYPNNTDGVKVAAGWLIEQCGWKGKKQGHVGVHERQALVLVNYGGGKGLEIKALAQKIQTSVLEKFGIELTPEVNFV
ncbi:MAG: UDP-N-acetylmuramate dehydrogenase [Saprospiraceae bacterium]|nr:UDP-N-acetylmuramate dehydrogenase [Saprospiraceae bacterium]